MSYYNEKPFFDTLKFSDIYPDVETFEEIIGEKCTSSELLSLSPLPELYRTLELKFYNAHTRYTTPETFTTALIRELRVAYEVYKLQVQLNKEAKTLEVAQIQKSFQNVSNMVENPNELNSNMDDTPIKNTSTVQQTITQLQNKLNAILLKYEAIDQDYQDKFYKKLEPLFRWVLNEDTQILFISED